VILFLDACAMIYLIESEAAFHARVVVTLRDLRQRFPDARLAVSRLSLVECLVKPMRFRSRCYSRHFGVQVPQGRTMLSLCFQKH
jgi:hypothetical protein